MMQITTGSRLHFGLLHVPGQADVEERVGTDRLFVAEPVVAGEHRKDGFAAAAIDLQCGAGQPLDRRAILNVGVKDLLELGGDRGVVGSRRSQKERNGAENRQSHA